MVVGGGFFLTCEDLGGFFFFKVSFPSCTFFFLSGDQLTHTDSTLVGQRSIHSGFNKLRQLWTSVTLVACDLISLVGSQNMSGQNSQPNPSSLGQGGYTCFAVTCHLHFWHNGRSLLRATAVTRGRNRYWNKIQHRKLTPVKKILNLFCRGSNPPPSDHEPDAPPLSSIATTETEVTAATETESISVIPILVV